MLVFACSFVRPSLTRWTIVWICSDVHSSGDIAFSVALGIMLGIVPSEPLSLLPSSTIRTLCIGGCGQLQTKCLGWPQRKHVLVHHQSWQARSSSIGWGLVVGPAVELDDDAL